jgi:hypothetical protein
VNAEKILKSFNTWSFKREQPSDIPLMLNFIAHAAENRKPIPFVLYWGKGLRAHITDSERQCLEFLDRMSHRIAAVHAPGAKIHLLFTDTHATLNGHDEAAIDAYFAEVERAATSPTFITSRLSDHVAKFDPGTGMDFAPVSDDLMEGAEEYFLQNMIERQAVEQAFRTSIFLTFNGSDVKDLFPSHLPIFYMYSIRKGTSTKPWFMDC